MLCLGNEVAVSEGMIRSILGIIGKAEATGDGGSFWELAALAE